MILWCTIKKYGFKFFLIENRYTPLFVDFYVQLFFPSVNNISSCGKTEAIEWTFRAEIG